MKKIISMLAVSALLASMVPASIAEGTAPEEITYIPGVSATGPTEYVAPTFYENEGGPTIGVTLVGVIIEDGKYFKDSDNDGELDVFEDWRLDSATRVADLVQKMNTEQRIGLLANQLMCSPDAGTIDQAIDENGNVDLSKIMVVSANAFSTDASTFNSTGVMLGNENRSGVIRKDTSTEVGALHNNALNMVAEYAAVAKNEPTIPFTLISNPMNTGYPGTLGMAAAAMGDGNYDIIERFATLDRQIWDVKGIDSMYGPQIDLVTDPRWPRNDGTYTEVPEVMAGIAQALVVGYQSGTDGAQSGDVALIMKHFPGDGASENGFESHNPVGQWRLYPTEGSLEKYQLVGFQAAIDVGLTGIMPGYSRPAEDGRSAAQSYRGVEINAPALGNAYNETIIKTLLYETMGFNGFINSDSQIISTQFFGVEDLTLPERYAAAINAGTDVIGEGFQGGIDYPSLRTAVYEGMIEESAFDRATTNRMLSVMEMGQFENPYRSSDESKAVGETLADEINALKREANQKSVVLMKNHDGVLPLKETGKNVFVASFTGKGEDEATMDALKASFEAQGFTIVKKADEADIAFIDVVPNKLAYTDKYMQVLDLVEGLEVDERDVPNSQEKTGEKTEVTTVEDIAKVATIAETVHANGGIVVGSINITSPWILTNLEPYCDALIGSFSTSVDARMDVLTGAYNPTGKLPVTMVSCNEVIAVNEQEIDGVVYEICVSPNDVPGYDKDQYMAQDVLAQSPSGSYAYQDADGNVYTAWFGLSY